VSRWEICSMSPSSFPESSQPLYQLTAGCGDVFGELICCGNGLLQLATLWYPLYPARAYR
jgi:hypothetical protein